MVSSNETMQEENLAYGTFVAVSSYLYLLNGDLLERQVVSSNAFRQ